MNSNCLNFSFRRLFTAGAVSAMLAITGGPVSAVPLIWDNSDNDQFWANLNNWDGSIVPIDTSDVELPKPIPGGSGILTLGAGSVANSLSFFAPYTLTGGDLALTSGGVRVTIGNTSTIASKLTGSGGILKTGDGALILTNASNDYTGTTRIDGGSVIVTDEMMLGTDASAVIVSGNATRASGGGNLTIGSANNNLTGLNWTRDLALTGGGPTGDGNALNSVGNNVFTGNIVTGGNPSGLNPVSGVPYTVSATTLASTFGTATISGGFTINPTGQTTNLSGNGNWLVTSNIDGLGNLQKTGSGLAVLTGDNSNFGGTVSINGGFLRVSSAANLGSNISANSIDLNSGTLEIRTDAPDFAAKKVRLNNSATIFVDRAVGGTSLTNLNQTVTLGALTLVAARTLTVTNRNGNALTFNGNMVAGNIAGTNGFTLNGNGLVTFAGTFWNQTNSTSRTMTVTVNNSGQALITGNILASGANHVLTKGGAGTLTLNGTASTYTGVTNINAGTLAIRDFRAVNNGAGSGAINIGSTTSAGTLSIGTASAPSAAGLTTSKVIALGGTSGGAVINANQTGADPVVINSGIGQAGLGTKTLTLGGSSELDNLVSGAITDGATGATQNSAAYNNVNTITLGSVDGISIGAAISGDQIKAGTTITAINPSTRVVTLSANTNNTNVAAGAGTLTIAGVQNITSLLKADLGKWVLSGANTYTGSTSILGGTLQFNATAPTTSASIADGSDVNLGVRNNVQNSGGILIFDGSAAGDTTETVGALSLLSGANGVILNANGFATNLTFSSLGMIVAGTGGTFANTGTGGGVVTLTGAANTNGMLNPHIYANAGEDFAAVAAGVVGPAIYTSVAGALTAGNTLPYLITGPSTSGAITVNGGVKFEGDHTLTVTGTTTIRDGANAGTAGGILVPSGANATITGGTGITSSSFTSGANGSTTNASSTVTMTSTAGIQPGMYITGTNIPTNTTVVSVTNGTTLVLSQNATATTTGTINFTLAGDVVIAADGTLNLATPITGANGLTKNGTGTLIISGTNAQTGVTNINAGTVQLSGTGKISGNSVTTNIRTGATLDLNGVTMSGTAIGQLNGGGTIRNTNTTAATLTFGNGNTGTGIFSGLIMGDTGVINLTKNGTSAATLSGLNTYTGVTTIASTGVVSVPNLADGGLESGIGASTSAASNLVFTGASATQAYGGLSYTGTDTISIDRLFTFGGTAANSGARIQANGNNNATLVFNNTGALAFGTANFDQGLVLGGASIGDNQFNPLITNNGTGIVSLYKADAGLWIIGNANTYTGSTTIRGGALRAEGSALPANSNLVLDGGVLQTSGTFSRSLTTTPTAGVGDVNWNGTAAGGFAASTSKLTVNIGGTFAPLTWATGGFAGGTLILSSTTSLAEVEFVNPIDLNGATRTIQVDTNTTTNSDLATLSGVISNVAGTAGVTKTGAGILRFLNDNTYNGDTAINGGTIRAVNIGNSTSTASNFGTGAGKITLGTGGTAGTLAYVGGGETTNREINLAGTTASTIIESSGSGALVLTNVVNTSTGTGAKTFFLRGDLNAANEITSDLTNNAAGGVLNVTKDDNGTWILSGNNTYTGTTTVSAGALGFASDAGAVSGPFGATRLTLSNGSLFALGGDRIIDTLVRFNGNASSNFIGINSITINNLENTTTGGNTTVTNSLPTGKLLTINTPTWTGGETTTARTFVFNGGGDTILNTSVTDTAAAAAISLTYNGYGSLTLGGNNGASTYTGTTTLTSGTLKVGSANAIPSGAGKGNLTINPGTGLTATLDVNGFNQTVNGITATTAGVSILDNSSTTAATLSVGANDQDVNFIGGTANSGTGALSLAKVGTGTATFSQGPFEHTGATSVEGGLMTLAEDVNGTSALNVSGAGSTLRLTGTISGADLIKSISVGDGSTLSLLNSEGEKLDMLTSLTLGSASGTNTNIKLNVGGNLDDGFSGTDTWTLLTGGVLNLFAGNKITFDLTDTNLKEGTTYTLFNIVDGGLTLGPLTADDFLLGATPGGFTSAILFVDNNVVQFKTGDLVTGDLFWNANAAADNWNDLGNWSTTLDGLTPATNLPGQGTNVVFKADNITGTGPVATTLEQNFKVNRLNFIPATNSANTPTSVTIGAGADPLARLEIAPQSSADGIHMEANGPANVTISTLLMLGKDQTWTVADANSTLTVSGALQGEADLIKAGLGKVILGTASAASFNPGTTSTLTVNAGVFEIQDVASLGSSAIGNLVPVTINSGGTFYYNGVAGTVANGITLDGGTISAGGANQTYSGNIAVNSNSIVDMSDNAGGATARNNTFSGIISGPGKLTINGTTTATAGNLESGQFIVNNNSNSWNGGILMQSGTIISTVANGLGTGDIEFNPFGRIIIRGTDGTVYDMDQAITFAGGAIGELSADNVSAALSDNFVVNFNGLVSLGAAGAGKEGIARFNLADVASEMNFKGGIVLKNNSSISVEGGDADSLVTIDSVISESGGSFRLDINNEAGAWAVTSTRLALTKANTYTGGTALNEGFLILGNKAALGTGGLNITGVSTIQASTDLSGADAVANAVTLSNTLTISGANSLTLGGIFNATGGNASRTLTNNLDAGKVLAITGQVNVGGDGSTAARTLTINGTGDTNISGAMVNNTAFAHVLAKSGSGTLILSNTAGNSGGTTGNTFTGGVTINEGIVRADASHVLPNTGTITVRSNSAANPFATLNLNGNSDTIAALTFGGTGGLATSVNKVITGAGILTLGGTLTVTATGDFTTAASITGNLALGGANRSFAINNSTGTDVDFDATEVVISNQGAVGGTARTLTKTQLGTMVVGNANIYTGPTVINGGVYRINTISNGGVASSLGASSNTAANLVLGGGTLQYMGGTASTDRSYTLTTATTSSVNVDLPGTTLTMSGASVATDGALTKLGSGTLELTGENLHTGLTTVSAGTLLVNNTSGNGLAGSVTVASGATLGGAGTILGSTTINGTVAAGNSVDMLTVGSFILGAGGNALFELSGATTNDVSGVNAYLSNPGGFMVPSTWTDYQDGVTLHDHIRISGGAPTFDSNGTITLSELGYTPVFGDVIQFFDWVGLGTASATGTPMFTLPSSVVWNTDLFQSHGLAFVVPEPGRAMLLMFGLLGLVMRRRRK